VGARIAYRVLCARRIGRIRDSDQDSDTVGPKNGICGNDTKAMVLGRGNDHAITWILVDRGQLGRLDADIKIQRKHLKTVMGNNGSEPFSRGNRQPELSLFVLDADLKTADGRDIDKGRISQFSKGLCRQWSASLGEPQKGACIQQHQSASGHSSGLRGSVGS
jgi:hypothetical protein